jgi:hypothetical protein
VSTKSCIVILILLVLAVVPAAAGTITSLFVTTSGNAGLGIPSGVWSTDLGWASIGVTAPGAINNPFLDPSPTGAMSTPSGSYLLFFGYEDRFAYGAMPAGAITLTLTVNYADSSFLTATFTDNVLTSPSIWTRDSGSAQLVIGSSGITKVDRNGSYSAGTYGANEVNDVVLDFSDTGSFSPGTGVPEPATIGLMAAGLCAAFYLKRRR